MDIKDCILCDLKGDNYAYPRIHEGSGKKVMFIGEAPGREEAKRHMNFVGRSGIELNTWINRMKIENYYITNIVRHRPILDNHDRPPRKDEVKACLPYLWNEIKSVSPDYIICLGSTAMKNIIEEPYDITTIVFDIDTIRTYMGKRVFVLYHPSYILRQYNMNSGTFFPKFWDVVDKVADIIHNGK